MIGDDVIPGRVGKLLRSERQMHANFSLRRKMRDQSGILGCDRSRWNSGGQLNPVCGKR